jgi:hypothetical protein
MDVQKRDAQQIHVEPEIEVRVGDVAAIPDVHDVPEEAVKCWTDLTEDLGKSA